MNKNAATYAESLRDGSAFEHCLIREKEGIALPIGWWNMGSERVIELAKRLGWNG